MDLFRYEETRTTWNIEAILLGEPTAFFIEVQEGPPACFVGWRLGTASLGYGSMGADEVELYRTVAGILVVARQRRGGDGEWSTADVSEFDPGDEGLAKAAKAYSGSLPDERAKDKWMYLEWRAFLKACKAFPPVAEGAEVEVVDLF